MKDIIQDVFAKINITKAVSSLTDHLPAKLAGSVVSASLMDIGSLPED